jgi:hypothetical protein
MLSPETMTGRSPRLTCVLSLALVFLCGAAAGGLAMNFGVHKSLHQEAFWTPKGKSLFLERIKKDLNLTPTQTEQMESILDDFSTYYRNVLADGKSRIFQILDDDQRRRFERMLQEKAKQEAGH